ncbi:MAG: DMT family transporter [Xanthobacteraceae bacterium]
MTVATKPPESPVVPLNTPVAPTQKPEEWADSASRPLDALAVFLVIILCVSWGLNQVAVKLALPDVPPVIQATIRAGGATLLLVMWMRFRAIPFDFRDGTLKPGLLIGILFTVEYILIYRGLLYTSASRSVVYLYTAPIFVAIGVRWFLPSDRFTTLQWIGLALSFAGIVLAFGEASPFAKPEQAIGNAMMLLAAIMAAGTTLVAKGTALSTAPFEKTLLYQLAIAFPLSALGVIVLDEKITVAPSAVSVASLVFQTIWVVGITYLAWYALVQKYSASRLAALTFLTPLFGVAAGHLVLDEPLTPSFLIAVVLVTGGTFLPSLPLGTVIHYWRTTIRGKR